MLALVIQLALANPASVYCVQQGGTLEIVRSDMGEVGWCALPDGRRVEEWTFFRENNTPEKPAGR